VHIILTGLVIPTREISLIRMHVNKYCSFVVFCIENSLIQGHAFVTIVLG